MRLLFLSNLYPPTSNGGYEQWCQEMADGLRARGHDVVVLTSGNNQAPVQPDPAWVHRVLHMEMEFVSLVHGLHFFTSRERREQANLECLEQQVRAFQPDLIFVWGMWNLPRSLPALAERLLPGRVVYYLADYWPILPSQHEFYWQAPAQSWFTRLPKSLLRPVALQILARRPQPSLEFARVIFPSTFLWDEMVRQGVKLREARVIYGAVDTRPFVQPNGSRPMEEGQSLSLLYAGRLSPEKGIQTAIEALEGIVHQRKNRDVKLTIAGSGEQSFVAHLHQRVRDANLESWVTFLGSVPKTGMPDLYRRFDAVLFPSTWQEPFGRVLVEALASEVVVVGTATGGAAEILQESENGLTFAPGDAAGLADQIMRLLEQPALRRRLVENGRRTALEKFDLSRMIAEIEAFLSSVLSQTENQPELSRPVS